MVHSDGPEAPEPRPSRTAGLRQYRLYFLDGVGSLISSSHEFEAADDDHAARISAAWREGRRAELWCGARKLKSWERSR